MTKTEGLTKYSTTRGFVMMNSIVDGYKATRIQHDNDGNTRLYLQGSGWTEWLPSTWPISYHI